MLRLREYILEDRGYGSLVRKVWALLRLRGKILEDRGYEGLGRSAQCCGYGNKSWKTEAREV